MFRIEESNSRYFPAQFVHNHIKKELGVHCYTDESHKNLIVYVLKCLCKKEDNFFMLAMRHFLLDVCL